MYKVTAVYATYNCQYAMAFLRKDNKNVGWRRIKPSACCCGVTNVLTILTSAKVHNRSVWISFVGNNPANQIIGVVSP